MRRATHDPRPELSIAIATADKPTLPLEILSAAKDAHHRYRVLPPDSTGSDHADLTLVWAPVFPDPLSWIGVEQPGATLRKDARILVVLAHTGSRRRKTHRELDELEQAIRERFYDLGVPGDEVKFVRYGRIPQSGEKPSGAEVVIEAINQIAQPRQSGFDQPFLSHSFRFHADPSARTQGTTRPGRLAQPTNRLFWRAIVEVGTLEDGADIALQGPQIILGKVHGLNLVKSSSETRPGGPVERFEKAEFTLVTQEPVRRLFSWRMVHGATRFVQKLDLRVTHACRDSGSILHEVPKMTERLSVYLPALGRSEPSSSISFGWGEDGLGVTVLFSTEAPVFLGPVFLVDHGQQIVLRCVQT